MPTWELPAPPAALHFVGIGGIGMSGLARLLHAKGYRISGSDASSSELIDQLRLEGIEVSIGHNGIDQVRQAGMVVHTAAVDVANPEIAAAVNLGLPILKRAELLAAIAATHTTIAVAGTHGKSTTSAMLASGLMELGLSPSYAVGAILESTGANAAFGSGELMVVEADEYDRSFLHLHPQHAIISNIEFDHPDVFDSAQDYADAFLTFAGQVSPSGALIVRGDDPGGAGLLAMRDWSTRLRVRTFGCERGVDWTVRDDAGHWEIAGPGGFASRLELQVPGIYNALNALAAVALMVELGIGEHDAIGALESYRGIGRRFEIKGEENEILVIDDYAHHPTEVTAILTAAAERFPENRIWAVFQPHTYSRTKALQRDFEVALRLAHHRVVLDVYGAREVNDGSVTDQDLLRLAGPDGYRAESLQDAAALLAGVVKPGDVVLTLGAGDITALGPMLLERLAGNPSNRPAKQ